MYSEFQHHKSLYVKYVANGLCYKVTSCEILRTCIDGVSLGDDSWMTNAHTETHTRHDRKAELSCHCDRRVLIAFVDGLLSVLQSIVWPGSTPREDQRTVLPRAGSEHCNEVKQRMQNRIIPHLACGIDSKLSHNFKRLKDTYKTLTVHVMRVTDFARGILRLVVLPCAMCTFRKVSHPILTTDQHGQRRYTLTYVDRYWVRRCSMCTFWKFLHLSTVTAHIHSTMKVTKTKRTVPRSHSRSVCDSRGHGPDSVSFI